jgi:phosphoesterase RecJ-like protein
MPSLVEQQEAVVRALRSGDRFLLTGHVDPDLDCLGSVLTLDWALRHMGKVSIPFSPDPLAPGWSFLPGSERVRLPGQVNQDEWDILVAIDCDVGRTGPAAEWAKTASGIINIDHHATNPADVQVLLLDPNAAATGQLIHGLVAALGLKLDVSAATLLYAAIVSDTGSFRFSNTSAEVLEVAADLVKHGADPGFIAARLYEAHTWGYIQVLRQVLQTLQQSDDGKVAWATLGAGVLEEYGVSKGESEGLVQYPRMIDGVEVALVFRELGPQETRVSLRSKGPVDVSLLAQEFGGGGHSRASGCTLYLPLADARRRVLARVSEVVEAHSCRDNGKTTR